MIGPATTITTAYTKPTCTYVPPAASAMSKTAVTSATSFDSTSFAHHETLDATTGQEVNLHWTVDASAETIEYALEVNGVTDGWVGLGFNGMSGSCRPPSPVHALCLCGAHGLIFSRLPSLCSCGVVFSFCADDQA